MAERLSELADALWPHLARRVGGAGSGAGALNVASPTDHGALTGLLDDDHPGYLTAGRGDVRYPALADWTTHIGNADAHHARSHVLASTSGLGSDHTVAGLTAGQYLRATGATAAAFALILDTDLPATIVRTSRTLTAGDGLTGGGDLSADRTFTVGVANTIQSAAGAGLSVEANAVRLTAGYNPGAAASVLASDATGKLTLPLMAASTSLTTPLILAGAGQSLTLQPSVDLILDPASNRTKMAAGVSIESSSYASQTTGWRVTDAGEADFRYLYVDEMHAKSFIADLEQALAGGQIIAKSVAQLYSNFTAPAAGATAQLVVRDLPSATGMAVFVNGDYIRIRTFSRAGGSLTIGDCWGTVALDTTYGTSGFDSTTKTQRYTFTRSSGADAGAMTAGTVVYADAIILDYGTAGNGIYEVNAIDGAYGLNSPYAQVATWATHPRTMSVKSRLGNLRGIFSVANEYGLYAGSGTAVTDRYIRASNAALELRNVPLALYDGTNNTMLLSAGASNNSPFLALGSTLPTGPLVNDGIWLGKDGSAYKWRVGTVSGGALVKGIYWDGADLIWKATNTSLDASGNLVAGPVTLSSAGVTSAATNDYANNAAYKFTSSGVVTSGTFAYATPTDTAIHLSTNLWGGSILIQDANRNAYTRVGAYAISTKDATSYFEAEARDAYGATVKLARIVATANGAQSSLDLSADTVKINTYTAWHAGNDGHNSTLDADTLDTYHASSFALLSGPTFTGHVKVGTPNTYDIGEAGVKWRTIYAGNIVADTISGTSLSGATWRNDASDMGIYSSAAGTRTLAIANDGAGVMNVTVDGSVTAGSFATAGNITVSGTVDGVDISAHAADTNAHHARSHAITSTSDHTATGLTTGHVLRASGTTTFAWAQLAHSDLSGVGTNSHATIDSHIAATAAHGVSGAIVGTTDTQTLTNKTLTTPTISGTGFTNAQHAHSGATSGGQIAHSSLTGIGANDHHAQSHVLATNVALGGDHTISGATAGHVLRASGATTALFAQLQHADLGGVSANQHHNQQHSITGSDHTITASAMQIIGATAANTLGLITPSSNPGAAAAILASSAAGALTLVDLTVTALTATRLVASDGSDKLVSVSALSSWVAGTSNRVTVADDGDGTITLSAPQDIHTAATPTFGGLIAPWLRPATDSTTALQLRNQSGTAIVNLDTTNSRVGINKTNPTYTLDVSGTGRFTSTLYADDDLTVYDALTVGGKATVTGDLQVGTYNGGVLQVSAAGYRVGINRAADSQFDLDVAGAIRGQYLVGPHALQLSDAIAIVHFDGPAPYNLDFSGTSNTHMGATATETGDVTYRPGKFSKAVQVGEATTNLVANPSFETNTTGWTSYFYQTPTASWDGMTTVDAFYGAYAYKITKTAGTTTDRVGLRYNFAVTSGVTYTISVHVKVPEGVGNVTLYADTGLPNTSVTVAATGDWQRLIITATATSTTTARFIAWSAGAAVHTMYIDAAQVEAKAYATPYADSSRAASWLAYSTAGMRPERGTVMCWAYPTGLDGSANQFVVGSVSGDKRFGFRINTNNQYLVFVGDVLSVDAQATAVAGVWQHLALTWDNGTYRFFKDGIETRTGSYTPMTALNASVYVGNLTGSATYKFNGMVDDLVLLSTAADAKLIRSIYESNAPVFAESSVVSFRAPSKSQIYVDELGFWAKGKSGSEAFAIYGGNPRWVTGDPPDTKSWGGLTLEENDVAIGRTTSGGAAVHWDDSENKLRIGVQTAEHLALTSTALQFMNATTEMAKLDGTTFTLGSTGGNHVEITSTTFKIKYGSTEKISLDSSGNASISGVLGLGASGGIYQGTGTFASPTTGLKIWNESSVGRIAGYNAGTIQWYAGTDGKLYAGGGTVRLESTGISVYAGTVQQFMVNTLGYLYAGNSGSGGLEDSNASFIVRANGDVQIGVYPALFWDASASKFEISGSMSILSGGSISTSNALLDTNGIQLTYAGSGGHLRIKDGATTIFDLHSSTEYSQANTLLKFYPISDSPGGNLAIIAHNAAGAEQGRMQFSNDGGINVSGAGTVVFNKLVSVNSTLEVTNNNLLSVNGSILLTEQANTPANPAQGTQVRMYLRNDNLIFQFNDGGTIRYKYMPLNGTGFQFFHTTTAP